MIISPTCIAPRPCQRSVRRQPRIGMVSSSKLICSCTHRKIDSRTIQSTTCTYIPRAQSYSATFETMFQIGFSRGGDLDTNQATTSPSDIASELATVRQTTISWNDACQQGCRQAAFQQRELRACCCVHSNAPTRSSPQRRKDFETFLGCTAHACRYEGHPNSTKRNQRCGLVRL